jgi:hypothetical protein
VAKAIAAGTDAVLAFNEPDGCVDSGSCMDISSAVAGDKQWMNPLAGQVRLGAPAVTNGGAPMGRTYLSNFLGNCTGCVIDFIPIHWYSDASHIANFKAHVAAAYAGQAAVDYGVWVLERDRGADPDVFADGAAVAGFVGVCGAVCVFYG